MWRPRCSSIQRRNVVAFPSLLDIEICSFSLLEQNEELSGYDLGKAAVSDSLLVVVPSFHPHPSPSSSCFSSALHHQLLVSVEIYD